jgi:hypothetical protein
MEVLVDHRELLRRVTVTDVGRDVVAVGHHPAMFFTSLLVGGDIRQRAHLHIIFSAAPSHKPKVALARHRVDAARGNSGREEET